MESGYVSLSPLFHWPRNSSADTYIDMVFQGDRFVTHTVLPSGQLCVRATNWRVTEAPIKVVKAHLESRAGKTLPSGDGARFKVDEAKCTIERFE